MISPHTSHITAPSSASARVSLPQATLTPSPVKPEPQKSTDSHIPERQKASTKKKEKKKKKKKDTHADVEPRGLPSDLGRMETPASLPRERDDDGGLFLLLLLLLLLLSCLLLLLL